MVALYNEIDPFAAAWLRELIKAGHIAPGIVVEDSIEDLHPNDLRAFPQVHLFAGIGVWSYALRRIGWPDDKPIWTGSCPCQPFSAAGKGAGFADERHLWPHFFHLVTQCRPSTVVGEQVASKDGLAWLDLVQADMEAAEYAFGAVDLCAAGVGAPHIRQRIWWVAQGMANDAGEQQPREVYQSREQPDACGKGMPSRRRGDIDGVGDPHRERHFGEYPLLRPESTGGRRTETFFEAPRGSGLGGVADSAGLGWVRRGPSETGNEPGIGIGHNSGGRFQSPTETAGFCGDSRPGPVNGQWRDADWLLCRDGKWRPVESGAFPLAHGASARVGRLRGYGNAIVAQAAEEFLRAALT